MCTMTILNDPGTAMGRHLRQAAHSLIGISSSSYILYSLGVYATTLRMVYTIASLIRALLSGRAAPVEPA